LRPVELPLSVQYKVLNPRGSIPAIKLGPLVRRVPDLNKKEIYIINTRKPHAEETLSAVAKLLQARFPQAKIHHVMKKTSYRDDEPDLWKEAAARADVAIVGPGD
jgi:hypothetical protein